jgi:hypothetical protein
MTRDEAITYINSHPAQFKGASQEEVLSKTQSSNDANYYDPTMFVPEQKATVVKPNTATRGATVTYPQSKPTVPVKVTPVSTANVTQGLFSNVHVPAGPTLAALALIAIGGGMVIYRLSR